MKLLNVISIIVGLITAVSSCPDCCTTYIRLTDTPGPIPSDTNECSRSCNVTINELSEAQHDITFEWYLHRNTTCSNKEFLFQSGVHHIKQDQNTLLFSGIDNLIIRGELNATIRCWDTSLGRFGFDSVPNVTIRDVKIWNCSCNYYFRGYSYVGKVPANVYHLSVEILNSSFIHSRLTYQNLERMSRTHSMDTKITIKDTTIENYSTRSNYSFLDFDGERICYYYYKLYNYPLRNFCEFFNITILVENVNFTKNIVPFFAPEILSICIFITFTGHNNFADNEGIIIRILPCLSYMISCHIQEVTNKVQFTTTEMLITNNKVAQEGAPFAIEIGDIVFEHCHVVFSGNHGTISGGFKYSGTKMVFNDNVLLEFSDNTGQEGGALFMGLDSKVIFSANKSNIALSFKNNSAQRGGAIYVNDNYDNIKPIFDLQCSTALVTLTFSANNSALFAGNQIFGGWVDWFRDDDGIIKYMPDITKEIINFESNSDSEIVSCPIRICMCKDHYPDCTVTNTTMEIYGYAVSLELVAVGQRFTPVPAYVQANLKSEKSDAKQNDELWRHLWPATESLQTACTKIVYKIYSTEEIILLEPSMDGCNSSAPKLTANDSATSQAILLYQQLSIHLKYKNCPLGFILHINDRNCVCQSSLSSLGLSCNVEASMIHRNKQQWVGVAHEHTTSSYEGPGVIVHQNCPFDYCRIDTDSLLIRLEDQTTLCAFNRSGVLCGGCGTKLSRVLGSSKCMICFTNLKLFAIILGWLLCGLLLVILFMLLDLTVSVGTINGLTFYANIIQAQHATFFMLELSNSFPKKFIAWLNLDQGIEMCLYDGLDDYTITWLQFLFPLYIWLIAAALIVSSHYSTRVSRLIGKNAVQVLATLFLITYAKLLRLIIEVFSFTTITYPDGYKKTVWLVDGNVEYLQGKHVPLSLVTLLFVLLSLPYTLILLTIQFLYKISHYRVMFWVQKLKPFFDAYTGPYKDNHRYWTGLLLIARIVLLTGFSLNQSNKPTINLFIIIVVVSTLLIWLHFTGLVYKNFLNNCLELFFLFNLSLTSIATLFDLSDSTSLPTVIYISTGTAFMVFVGIVLYHAVRRLLLFQVGTKLKKFIQAAFSMRKVNNDPTVHVNGPNLNVEQPEKVGCTAVKLTQPLLDEVHVGDGGMVVI